MCKCKQPLDMYDVDFMPQEMRAYLRNYGFSFSKKACEYAVSLMKKENPSTKKTEKIEPWSKEQVEDLLKKHNNLRVSLYIIGKNYFFL